MVRLFRKRSSRRGEQYGRAGNHQTRVISIAPMPRDFDFEHERRQDQPSFSNHSNSSTVGASLAPHDQFYLEVPIKNRIPKGILRSPKSNRQAEEEAAASLDLNSTVSSITENTADFRRAEQKELQASLLHQNNNNKSMVLRSKEHAQSRAKAYREQQQSTAASSRQTQSTSTLSVLVSSCFSCSTTAASQNVVLEEPNSIVDETKQTTSQPQEKTGGRLKDTGMFALCGGTPGPNDYVDEPPVAPITIDPRKYNDDLEEQETQQQRINDHLQQQHQTITPVEPCESSEDDEFLTYMEEDEDEHDDAEREDVDTAVSIPPPPLPQFRTSSRGLSRGSSFKKSKSFQKVRSFLSSRGRYQVKQKQDYDPVIVPSSATAHQINGNNKYFLGQQRDEESSFVRQQYPPPPQFQSTHYYHERQPPKRHRSFQKVRSFLGMEKKHHHQTNLYRAAE